MELIIHDRFARSLCEGDLETFHRILTVTLWYSRSEIYTCTLYGVDNDVSLERNEKSRARAAFR